MISYTSRPSCCDCNNEYIGSSHDHQQSSLSTCTVATWLLIIDMPTYFQVGVVHISDQSKLYLLPTSSLTEELGEWCCLVKALQHKVSHTAWPNKGYGVWSLHPVPKFAISDGCNSTVGTDSVRIMWSQLSCVKIFHLYAMYCQSWYVLSVWVVLVYTLAYHCPLRWYD